jgi:hypothetical protein
MADVKDTESILSELESQASKAKYTGDASITYHLINQILKSENYPYGYSFDQVKSIHEISKAIKLKTPAATTTPTNIVVFDGNTTYKVILDKNTNTATCVGIIVSGSW